MNKSTLFPRICPVLLLTVGTLVQSQVQATDRAGDNVYSRPTQAILSSNELAQAAAYIKKARWKEAESVYCDLMSKMQLSSGFGDPNWIPALQQLAVVYKAEHRPADQAAALELATGLTSGVVPKTYVGTVEMLPDSSIIIRKRINTLWIYGDAFIHLTTKESGHDETCSLVKGLVPGQTKLLPPWPGAKDPSLEALEIDCGIKTDTRQIQLVIHSEYRFATAHGKETVTTDNSFFPNLALHGTAHALDLERHYPSHSQEFIGPYFSDANHFSIPQRIKFAFYLQPRFGTEETYASIYEALIAKRKSQPTPEDEALFAAFPAVTEFLTNDMKQREEAQPSKPPAD